MFEMKKKGRKRLKKSISTSFRVSAAPKSWSKYTTKICQRGFYLNYFFDLSSNYCLSQAEIVETTFVGSRISDKETTLFLVVSSGNDSKRDSFLVIFLQVKLTKKFFSFLLFLFLYSSR